MDYLCTGTQFMDYMYKGKHVYTGKHMYTGKNMYTDKNMYTGTKFMDYMHTGKNTRFWEGGLGCRDKARMTRQDPHKYRDSKVSFAAPEAFTVLHSPKALMLLRLGSCQSTCHLTGPARCYRGKKGMKCIVKDSCQSTYHLAGPTHCYRSFIRCECIVSFILNAVQPLISQG